MAKSRVIVAGIVVHQAGGIKLLAGEAIVGVEWASTATAPTPESEIALVARDLAVGGGFQERAAEMVAVEVVEATALLHADALTVEEIVFGDGGGEGCRDGILIGTPERGRRVT